MKIQTLEKRVQKEIDKEISKHSKHFSSEIMNNQIEALIKVIAPLLEEKQNKQIQRRLNL